MKRLLKAPARNEIFAIAISPTGSVPACEAAARLRVVDECWGLIDGTYGDDGWEIGTRKATVTMTDQRILGLGGLLHASYIARPQSEV